MFTINLPSGKDKIQANVNAMLENMIILINVNFFFLEEFTSASTTTYRTKAVPP